MVMAPGVNTYSLLALELVTYTWTVTPTWVQDIYDIELEATFTTNVPVGAMAWCGLSREIYHMAYN